MSAREILQYKTTTPITLAYPTDVTNQNPLDNTDDGSTCSAKIFDAGKDNVLTADEAAAQTVLDVANAGDYDVDDTIELELDDGTIHSATISSIDTDSGEITIGTQLPSQASVGNRFRTKLGATITMLEYGTPKLGMTDWGFRGTILETHVGLIPDLEVDIEIIFIGAVAGGLNRVDVIRAIVRELDLA